MRVILFILIVVVVALLIALATGIVRIPLTRAAEAPKVSLNSQGVSVKGGQTPTFDIETGSVAVGTKRGNVPVPVVRVAPPEERSNSIHNAS